ncbi:MAG: hypothetical protein ACJARX_001319 [Psychroserpens sp.]
MLRHEIRIKKIGPSFLNKHTSFYSICYDEDHKETVINAVIHSDDIKKLYDIELYYYDISIAEGLEVLKSITFLDE